MDLYVVRHGIAQQLGQKNNFTDEKRTLTSDGRERVREIAKGAAKLGLQLDLMLTSPLARAAETADILANSLDLNKKELVQTENLGPGGSADALFAEIKTYAEAEAVALVGHEPDLSHLISRIVQGNGALALRLKRGGICYINVLETVPTLNGRLIWLLTPKQLRMLAKL